MPYFGNITIVDSSDDSALHGKFYARVEKLGIMARYSDNLKDARRRLAHGLKSHIFEQKMRLEENLEDMQTVENVIEASFSMDHFLNQYAANK
jgi:hypothetical protein